MAGIEAEVTEPSIQYEENPGGMRSLGVEATRKLIESMPQPLEPVAHKTENVSIEGPHGDLPLRIFRPVDVDKPLPGLLYFHGGGMIGGSIDSFDYFARRLAAETGAVVVSVDYRLAPEHKYPVANDEAYAAWLWLLENHHLHGIHADLIGVAGDSAGGSLAASVSLRAGEAGGKIPAVQLLMYPGLERANSARSSIREFAESPQLNVADVVWMKAQYLGNDESLDTADGVPLLATDLAGMPPSVIVTAELDPLRDSAEEFGSRLRDASVSVATIRFPGVGHGFMAQAAWIEEGSQAFNWVGGLLARMLKSA